MVEVVGSTPIAPTKFIKKPAKAGFFIVFRKWIFSTQKALFKLSCNLIRWVVLIYSRIHSLVYIGALLGIILVIFSSNFSLRC